MCRPALLPEMGRRTDFSGLTLWDMSPTMELWLVGIGRFAGWRAAVAGGLLGGVGDFVCGERQWCPVVRT